MFRSPRNVQSKKPESPEDFEASLENQYIASNSDKMPARELNYVTFLDECAPPPKKGDDNNSAARVKIKSVMTAFLEERAERRDKEAMRDEMRHLGNVQILSRIHTENLEKPKLQQLYMRRLQFSYLILAASHNNPTERPFWLRFFLTVLLIITSAALIYGLACFAMGCLLAGPGIAALTILTIGFHSLSTSTVGSAIPILVALVNPMIETILLSESPHQTQAKEFAIETEQKIKDFIDEQKSPNLMIPQQDRVMAASPFEAFNEQYHTMLLKADEKMKQHLYFIKWSLDKAEVLTKKETLTTKEKDRLNDYINALDYVATSSPPSSKTASIVARWIVRTMLSYVLPAIVLGIVCAALLAISATTAAIGGGFAVAYTIAIKALFRSPASSPTTERLWKACDSCYSYFIPPPPQSQIKSCIAFLKEKCADKRIDDSPPVAAQDENKSDNDSAAPTPTHTRVRSRSKGDNGRPPTTPASTGRQRLFFSPNFASPPQKGDPSSQIQRPRRSSAPTIYSPEKGLCDSGLFSAKGQSSASRAAACATSGSQRKPSLTIAVDS